MLLKSMRGETPRLHPSVRAAETAVVIGDVCLEAEVNLWYGAVLRGDMAPITVGQGTNIQDNAVLHCDGGVPCRVGRRVSVGHGAVIHSATVGDGCLIGMGATLLTGCTLGKGCIVGGGTLVPGKLQAPDHSLIVGVPGRVVRTLTQEEVDHLQENVEHYLELARESLTAWEAPELETGKSFRRV